MAFQGLVTKTALEVRTSNLAREAAINAGFPSDIGGHTVAMVRSCCISL